MLLGDRGQRPLREVSIDLVFTTLASFYEVNSPATWNRYSDVRLVSRAPD
jgi:hypothetical protein